MIISIALFVVGLFVVLSAVAYFGQGRMTFAPGREIETEPHQVGLACEDIFINVSENERIHAWYFPATSTEPTSKTVLFCHGNAGNISHRLTTAQLLLELGVNVLMVEYRGYGRSDGEPSETNMYADAQAAYDWLLDQKQLIPDNIFLFGRSLGGAVAVEIGVANKCGGVIVESSFTSIVDMGKRIYPYLPVSLLARYKFDSISKIGRVRCKVLVTHSPDDEMIPYEMGRRLFDAAPDERTFVVLTGGHNDQSYFGNAKYRNGLQDFFGITGTSTPDSGSQID
jgi:hypothetical protein